MSKRKGQKTGKNKIRGSKRRRKNGQFAKR